MSSLEDLETLVDLVSRDRRSDAVAIRAPAVDQVYDYDRLHTTAWKTANFLHARGVRARSTVGVADAGRAETVLAVLGSGLLGARAYVGAPVNVDARAVVAHVDDVDEYDLDPGSQRIAYGGSPETPDVYHFEGDVWSENPTIPPEADDRSPVNVVLVTGVEARTHGELIDAARDVVDRLDLTAEGTVAVRAPLSDPRALVAGVLAPLAVGGTVVFPEDDTASGDVAVVGPNATASEDTTFDVRDLEL
jgi:hypothetical protein